MAGAAPEPGLTELLALAEEAARKAGEVLAERFRAPGPEEGVTAKSTPTDLVSEADREAERVIEDLLAARRPQDGVLSEESGETAGESGVRWVVDPLDGTTNFVFGVPHWAVSVACEDEAGPLAGVVFDPLRGELFAGIRGGGATLDGARLGGRERAGELGQALVATGFGYDAAQRSRQGELAARLLPRVRDLRRFGSAALDLAWTAAGRYDAFYEHGIQAWDMCAGLVLCGEAELEVRRFAEGELPAGIAVAPPHLIDALADLVAA